MPVADDSPRTEQVADDSIVFTMQGESLSLALELSGQEIDGELVDVLPAPGAGSAIEPARYSPPPLRTVAAVAATGFVAGAATVAVLNRQRGRRPSPRSASRGSGALRRGQPVVGLLLVDVQVRRAPAPRA